MEQPNILARTICEFIGTFALMFVGGAAILHTTGTTYSGTALIVVALAHGLILSVMVSAAMHISGGQFNPAVSLALAAIGKQSIPSAIILAIAQCAGAVAAAWTLSRAFSADAAAAGKLGATLGSLSAEATIVPLFALEVIATFLLMFVILGSAVDQRGVGKGPYVGGFAIGLCVSANILCFGPLTGASMNPARSLGPALIGGHWDVHWVYWAAPIAGAVAAAIVWRLFLDEAKP
ncbi:MAG: aquaporin [Phycisphaerales bacterium]|nr:aquaporin [Phycisphaerales bacterium]